MENTGGILAIDIGGSHIKMTLLDSEGNITREYERAPTPVPAVPAAILETLKTLEKNLQGYEKIAVGFPGYVKDGIVMSAPNLSPEDWKNVNLAHLLQEQFSRPARVINDADMQGLGVASGKGFEIVITLGTGFGTALLKEGVLLPHLELAHHPLTKSKTYDNYIGEKALKEIGTKKWNKRLQKILEIIRVVFNYDTLYLGGGNAAKITFPLSEHIKIVSNQDGIHGGAKLWRSQ